MLSQEETVMSDGDRLKEINDIQLLGVARAARVRDCDARTIREWFRRGLLKPVDFKDGHPRFLRADVLAVIPPKGGRPRKDASRSTGAPELAPAVDELNQ